MEWNIIGTLTQTYIALPELVVVDTDVPKFHSTAAPSSGGASHLRRVFRRVFSYIPASGGSGMQISPIDTQTVPWCGACRTDVRVIQQRPQAESWKDILTDILENPPFSHTTVGEGGVFTQPGYQ